MKHASDLGQNFQVYLRKEIPASYHYSSSNLISPIIAITHPGHFFIEKKDNWYYLRGSHGFSPSHSKEMMSIFIGHGPSIRASKNLIPHFKNIELYNLMCKLMGVRPAPNNASQGAIYEFARWFDLT